MAEGSKTDRILIIEDDREIANLVALHIQDLGLETEHAYDGPSGLSLAAGKQFDLIILDLMLPGMDGISVCREIRKTDPYTPILMLTAKAEEIDRVLGLELGADDYMTKPFSIRELTARVKALLRRSRTGLPPNDTGIRNNEEELGQHNDHASNRENPVLCIGSLTMDTEKRKVILNNHPLELTVKEYELLGLFMRNPGRAYRRTDLLNLIWGYHFEGYEHTVNTHINRLRNKIEEDPGNPEYLKTVWGIGYRFAEPEEFEQ